MEQRQRDLGYGFEAVCWSNGSPGTVLATIAEHFRCFERSWCPEEDSNLLDLAIASI